MLRITGASPIDESAACLLGIAEMLENLIPLLDCGCQHCVRSAAKGFLQIGEELQAVVMGIPADRWPRQRHRVRQLEPIHDLSAPGLRRLAHSARALAERLSA